MFILLTVPCTWFCYNRASSFHSLYFLFQCLCSLNLVLFHHHFPPLFFFRLVLLFPFFCFTENGSLALLWSSNGVGDAFDLIFMGEQFSFLAHSLACLARFFAHWLVGWLVLQYLLPISWLVGLFCKDLLPISWLVLQGFLFCSILVSVGLPLEWALFTCPTFGHHSDLTIQYNQQAEYIHLDTSDLTTISTSHSLQLTYRSLLTTLSANHKFEKWKRSWHGDKRHLRSYNHLRLTLSLSLLCAI